MVLVEGGVGALWTPRTGTSLVDKTTEGFLEEACGPPAGRTGAGRRGRQGQVGVAVGDGRRQPWVLFPCYSIFHEDLPCPLNQTLTFESLGSLGGALRHAGSRALGSLPARPHPGGVALSKALPLAVSRFPCLGREGAGDPARLQWRSWADGAHVRRTAGAVPGPARRHGARSPGDGQVSDVRPSCVRGNEERPALRTWLIRKRAAHRSQKSAHTIRTGLARTSFHLSFWKFVQISYEKNQRQAT